MTITAGDMGGPAYQRYSCHDTWARRLLRGLYSALVPGSGQLAGGARKRGYVLLGVIVPIFVAFVLVVLLARERGDEFAAWMLEPSLLLGLLAADIVLLLFRVYAVVDAVMLRRSKWTAVSRPGTFRATAAKAGKTSERAAKSTNAAAAEETAAERDAPVAVWPPRIVGWRSRMTTAGGGASALAAPAELKSPLWKTATAGLALMLVLGSTAALQVWLGYVIWKGYDGITTVFVDETTTSTSLATTTTEAGPGGLSSTTSLSGDTTTTVSPVTVDVGDDQRLTILFLGSDAGVGRSGARADTTIVASFDLVNGWIALFSLPRNAGDVPLSDAAQEAMGMTVYRNWMTGLYGSARRHPELAPEGGDPGAVVMRDTVSLILGIPIDYYAVVDMLGFVNLIDIMGGVKVYLDKPVHLSISPPTEEEPTLVYDFDAGVQKMDGRQALAFARTRHDSSDYVRMGRQRCVIAALMDQTGVGELAWNFGAIMDVIKAMVRTDIPIDAIQQLVKLRSSLKTDQMITVGFIPPKYTNGTNGNTQQLGWRLDYKLIQATVKRILEHPEEVLAEEKSETGMDTGDCYKKARE